MRDEFTPTHIARFWAKVDRSGPPGSCWVWRGAVVKAGYGNVRMAGSHFRAHRVSWELANGPIPDGLLVCHDCPRGDNRRCVNPAHLFLGTNQENVVDMMVKGRATYARLTADDVRAIRAAAERGETKQVIAERYGVCRGTVQMIKNRRTWSYIE